MVAVVVAVAAVVAVAVVVVVVVVVGAAVGVVVVVGVVGVVVVVVVVGAAVGMGAGMGAGMMAATPLTAEQLKTWGVARYIALDTAPYLARVVLTLRPWCPPVEGVAHLTPDGVAYISADVLDRDPTDIADWMTHTVWHLLRHHERLNTLPDPLLASMCGCVEINDDIPATTATQGRHPHDLGWPSGLLAEEYYRMADGGGGCDGCGSAAGDDPAEWEQGDGDNIGDIDTIAAVVAQQLAEYARSHPGTVPGGLVVWADSIIGTPKVSWEMQLAGLVGNASSLAAGRDDWSYRRPSRRSREDVVLPGMIRHEPVVGVVVDTSGSMGRGELAGAMAEVAGVIDAVEVGVLLVSCDVEASEPRHVDAGGLSAVQLVGGGGTDMTGGIAAVLAADTPVDLIVVLTDGDTPWPATPPGPPVVVVLVAGDRDVPPWARKVVVEG